MKSRYAYGQCPGGCALNARGRNSYGCSTRKCELRGPEE